MPQLIGAKNQVRVGQTVNVTLNFQQAGELTIAVPVEAATNGLPGPSPTPTPSPSADAERVAVGLGERRDVRLAERRELGFAVGVRHPLSLFHRLRQRGVSSRVLSVGGLRLPAWQPATSPPAIAARSARPSR